MVDHGCDNGRLFCVLLTRVENLSSLRGRKTNEGKKKKKKNLSVCNPAKPGAFM